MVAFAGRSTLVLVGALLLLSGCAVQPHGKDLEPVTEYLDELRRLESAGRPFASGSEQERVAVDRFEKLLGDFKAPGFRERVREVYAEELFFNDTLTTIRNRSDLEEYLAHSADALESGTVDFLGLTNDDGSYFFRWRMNLRFKRLAGGQETVSVGMSHVRFNSEGEVVLHQDFWDSASGLFEHMPVVGWMIRSVKRRL